VRDIEAAHGISVQVVVAAGNAVDAMLQARLRAGNPPDAAVFSEPALIAKYASDGTLKDLPPAPDTPEYWTRLATRNGRLYGYWLKAAHKSLLWQGPDTDLTLDTWDDLTTAAMPPTGTPLLSIGAADGWVLTDWLANMLAGLAPDSYDGLATGAVSWRIDPVREALSMLGRLWTTAGLLPGGPSRALLTAFDGSVVDVFGTRRARLVYEGDFVAPVVTGLGGTPKRRNVMRFPRVGTDPDRPVIVGGDVMVALSDRAKPLLRHLIEKPARERWVGAEFLVPSTLVEPSDYRTGLSQWLAEDLVGTTKPLFGLSDRLTGGLAGDDGKGSWLIMQNFFREVTGRAAIRAAVSRAVDAFEAARTVSR